MARPQAVLLLGGNTSDQEQLVEFALKQLEEHAWIFIYAKEVFINTVNACPYPLDRLVLDMSDNQLTRVLRIPFNECLVIHPFLLNSKFTSHNMQLAIAAGLHPVVYDHNILSEPALVE